MRILSLHLQVSTMSVNETAMKNFWLHHFLQLGEVALWDKCAHRASENKNTLEI
jgi:hypothetical protein